jgi:hypothetical protein
VGLKCPYIQHGTSNETVYAYSDYINAAVLNSYEWNSALNLKDA